MIIKKFEEIVGRFPGKTALKTSSKSLTYAELNFNANRVAQAITRIDKEADAGAGVDVKKQQAALLFDYDITMIVGLLGALKANKTYVPLDFSYPGKRLLFILENSETYLILTDNRNLPLAQELSDHADAKISVLNIDAIGDEIPGTPIDREAGASGERTAYILYTSGSTGKPKGVFQIHRNVLYYARNWINRFSITEADRMSLLTAFTHDGAIPDIFSALLSGACLYPYSMKENGRVEKLSLLLANEKITIWHSTPSLFRYFTGALTGKDHFPDVRLVLLGGEPLRAHDLELHKTSFGDAFLVNVYGQTESTVSSLCVIDPQNTFDDVSLGEPPDETKIFLMDEDGDMVEEMGGGEIVVACDYVAPGYWKDKENSEKVFLHDEHRGRLYRTGDMGRFTARGSIKMTGRKDSQVKIRGFRIELGDIETALLQHYAVAEAIVGARPDENNDNYLCAYIVSSQAISSEDLRDYLCSELPDYMMPRYFIFLEKMPVTSSGKIDRQRLPEPGKVLDSRAAYVAPANEIEEKVAAIWQEVLKVEKIGVNDNFTELGGHSLLVMSIISKMHRELNVELQLTDVFDNPTIKELSRLVMKSKQTIFSAIEPVEEREYYLLSSAQKRLYILQRMNPDNTAYNMPETIPLPAGYDWKKIEGAFKRLIKRHESLRTSFHMVNDTPVQRIHEHVEFEIEYYNEAAKNAKGREEGKGDPLWSPFIRPFDLSQAPLLRAGVMQVEENTHLLMVDMHHIISDGVSHDILSNDFQAFLYDEKELPPLRLQYKDFSVWQNSEREKETHNRQEEYWLMEFAGELPVLDLPIDYPRPVMKSFEGSRVNFEISAEETQDLNAVAFTGGATLFMVLAAVFNILLSKLSGQEEIIIGTPIAGRRHADLGKIIGMFVNTLALRNYPAGYRAFREFLGDVKEKLLMVFENREYPFEELVDKLSVKRDTGRNPLFDIMFVSQNTNTYSASPGKETEFEAGWSVQLDFPKKYENIDRKVKFDLTLIAMERNQGLFLIFQYCTKLFKKETIERFIIYFKKIVSVVVKEPDIRINDIEIVSEAEKERILNDFNETDVVYPGDKTIHQLFEEQVERTPDQIITVGAEGEAKKRRSEEEKKEWVHLSYGELNNRSNHIANRLRSRGVKHGAIIGIMVEPTLEMVVGIVGILKAGCVFLPIEPGSPVDRKNFVLNDSNASILLTQPHLSGVFKTNSEIINIEDNAIFTGESKNVISDVGPADPIYVIYTSGTSGRPKGVLVANKNMVNYVYWFVQTTGLSANDRAILTSSFAFDALYTQFFSSLLTGRQLHVIPRETFLFAERLINYLRKNKITYIKVTPSLFNLIVNSPAFSAGLPGALRFIMLGGEEINVNDVEKAHKLCPHLSMMNHYGPTETTIGSIARFLDFATFEEYKIAPTIGKPLNNTRVYVLDKGFKMVPIGVVGGLFIGGDGVGMGYLNKPELTAEKFIDFHHSSFITHHSILYYTGDLARWRADGNIEFLGRADDQVKIRGYRIEPGEIENRLLKYNDVKEAVVMSREKKNGEKYLCAYYVSEKEIEVTLLRDFLSGGLPQPMIPSCFVQLEKMPLTRHNKLNRWALPEPSLEGTGGYAAPGDEVEAKLVETWADVLGIEKDIIGINDNFFQLGGHSLKATILVSKIHKIFNVKIPLTEIFKKPTISGLSEYINDAVDEKYTGIEPVEEKEYHVLSSAQKRLYFLQQMDKGSTAYNIPSIMILEGILDKGKLEQSIRGLIRRHESLRTSIEVIEEGPVQRIHEHVAFKTENHDLAVKDAKEREGVHHSSFIIHHFIRAFDLSKAPLLRVGLVKLAEVKHIFMVDMHHIISDGMSTQVLVQDFSALYAGNELPEIKLQYKDYAEWQNREKVSKKILEQGEYWEKEYEGEIPVLELQTDYARPAVQGFEGNGINFEINSETSGVLKALALERGATLYIVLLALYTILLAKLSGREDIVIGSPVAGRRHADLEKIIGMFVNTLALRNYPSGEKKFSDFLEEVKGKTLKAFENQEYPYEDLVEKVAVTRDVSRNPLFDTMFLLQNVGSQGIEIPGLKLVPYEYENKTSKFDLSLTVVEVEEKLLFTFGYSTKLFKRETLERFIVYFKNIVRSIVENKNRRISDLEVLTEEEKRRILFDFNDTKREYPKDKNIHRLFEEQVEKTPDRIALVGTDHRVCPACLTYCELNDRSGRLAHILIEKGVLGDNIVGIIMERSIEMIIGIMGILKSGGAYLPIDPEYPQERIDYILKDSNAKIIVGNRHACSEELNCQLSIVNCELLMSAPCVSFHHSSFIIHHSKHLAYIIYTSGSTGKPKGVMVEHRSVINILAALQNEYPLEESDTYLLKTSYLFDVSVTELFGWFWEGGRLAVLESGGEKDPQCIIAAIRKWEVTHINFVPSVFNAIVEILNPQRTHKLSSLKYIFLAGEALLPGLVEKFRQFDMKILLENIYGPTEGTIYASKYSLSGWEGIGSIPIGKPLSNIVLYILDKRDHIQPVGVAGEMCIGGAGVARGYLNKPELTAEKFYRSYWSYMSYILYKTGDLARWLPDPAAQGAAGPYIIEFLGRIDHQVKIRGFRVELGEIEYGLSAHPRIKEAIVITKEGNGDKYLCAYVTPNNTKETEPQDSAILARELQDYLSNRLPHYMVPAHFVMLEKIPLTTAGKVDRQALSNLKDYSPGGSGATYVAPGNDMEQIVADIWKEILHLEEVGIHDNFFTLGGNSITILKVNNRLEMKLEKSFPVVKMFKYPTVHTLASYLLHGDDEALAMEKEKKISGKLDIGKDRLKERSRRKYQRN